MLQGAKTMYKQSGTKQHNIRRKARADATATRDTHADWSMRRALLSSENALPPYEPTQADKMDLALA